MEKIETDRKQDRIRLVEWMKRVYRTEEGV